MPTNLHAVTGAFGYSGRFIARRLLDSGLRVRTLTNSRNKPNPFGDRIDVRPLSFDSPPALAESLRGVRVLYNTYWVRFNHKAFTHAAAVRNTMALFDAAKASGVERIVHVSITNPSEDSPLEYFRGKARLERALRESGVSHAILRPAVLFGHDDILINNIAWILRHFPVFPIPGDGLYRLQPIYVEDLADLAVRQSQAADSTVINAIGPETFTYRGLIGQLGEILRRPRPIVSVSPLPAYTMATIAGRFLHDVVVTREEIAGLMANLLYVEAPPAGTTRLTDWAKVHAATLGARYASELARRC